MKILEGETYQGSEIPNSRTPVVGKIGGLLFDMCHDRSYNFYEAADAISEDAYVAMTSLFTYDGKAKNTLRKKIEQRDFLKCGHCMILYISDVHLTEDSMCLGLGMEMIRALVDRLQKIVKHQNKIGKKPN